MLVSRGLLAILIVTAMAVLGGCGPVYKTVYDYTSPPSPEGQICASKCSEISNLCVQNCELKEDQCISRAREDAARDFDYYVRQRKKDNLPIEKDLDDFLYTGGCYTSRSCKETCDNNFRQCFVGCGGSYTSREVCTAFCDQK